MQNIVECIKRIPTAIVQRAGDAVSQSLSLPMDFAFVPIGSIFIIYSLIVFYH